MGIIVAKLKRPLRRFNVDNRARAVISRDKPIPAPKHEASIKQLKLAEELNPNFLENHYKKDLKLDEHLRSIYVTSTDPKVAKSDKQKSKRSLPRLRIPADFEYGFYIPDSIPEGKCTLKQIFEIIIRNNKDSVKYNVNFLVAEYKLDKETVEKLLDHYKLFQLITPLKQESEEEEVDRQQKIMLQKELISWYSSKKQNELEEKPEKQK